MERTRIIRGVAAVAAVAMLVGACSTAASPSAAPASEAPSAAAAEYTLGFSNSFGIGNGFREEQLCTAVAQALVSGQVKDATWIHQKEDTYPQLQQLRDLIAKNPSAIVFNPLDKEALNPAIQEAKAAGIKMIAIDAYVTEPDVLNLSNDQVGYGYTGAKWLFEQMGGKGKFLYMRGLIGHPADADRHEGVMKAMSEFPDIEAVPSKDGVDTKWDPTITTNYINDFITSGQYDGIQGIWTSGMDSQVVDAIQAAGKPYVPIVGADLKLFVGYLLNKDGKHDGLKGIAVYNPAAVGGAGVTLALKALNGEDTGAITKTVKDNAGNDVQIQAVFLPTPEAWDNVSPEGKAKLEEIYNPNLQDLWPVSWYINGWTDYTFDQMNPPAGCKGPGKN
ncbi:MAG: sugar transporter substrate-binding protein [Chloroflexi bacterium]|nr:sugar transporter substrate-binding protein [Chloroflexota bacterium]